MYEIGDKISFVPTTIAYGDNGKPGAKEWKRRNTVNGVVTSVHKAHRWYRVEWKPQHDHAQHECLKY